MALNIYGDPNDDQTQQSAIATSPTPALSSGFKIYDDPDDDEDDTLSPTSTTTAAP